jgi:hypothetical protein
MVTLAMVMWVKPKVINTICHQEKSNRPWPIHWMIESKKAQSGNNMSLSFYERLISGHFTILSFSAVKGQLFPVQPTRSR